MQPTTVGLHDVSDIVFRTLSWLSTTDGDVNPGQFMTNADRGTISITDQDDVVYWWVMLSMEVVL